MKTFFFLLCLVSLTAIKSVAQVKISTTPGAPNSAAILELESSNRGLLLPRMINTDMRSILNPPKGLMVFNTTDSAVYFRRDTGWTRLGNNTACAFYAAINSSQTINNFTYTTLVPYLKSYDAGFNFDVNTGIFTAKDAGVYHFEIGIVVPYQPSNTLYSVRTYINGFVSAQKSLIAPSFDANFNTCQRFPFDIKLNANDAYSFQFLQRTGGGMGLAGTGSLEASYFTGFKVY